MTRLLVNEKINKIKADNINITKSMFWKLARVIVPKIATGIPRTTQILKMLLPMILPSNKSCSPLRAETIVVTSSGSEVPKATIVKEITLSLTPINFAIFEAWSTTNLLPTIIPANPIKQVQLILQDYI